MSDTPREPTPDLRSDPDVPGGIRYDPDLAVHEPAETPGEPSAPSRRRSPLILFPLGLVVLAIIVYLLFGLIASEGKTSAAYLSEIRMRRTAGLRRSAVYRLGALDSGGSIGPVRSLLNDPVKDVAWNAALALARRGDRSGLPVLARMLERSYLDRVQRPDESGQPRGLSDG